LQGGEIRGARKSNFLSSVSSFIGRNIFSKILKPLLLRDSQCISLFRKDFLYQFHDIKNIQQNLVLLSLVIIYFFSISSLPLNWLGYGVQLRYIISFFNIGLILIIIASLCSKLVYPTLVYEGNYLWILKTAPITSKKFIWTKFFFLLLPVLILGQLLTVFSSFFVQVDKVVFILNILTTTLLCLSLVGLSIFFSINELKNAIKETGRNELRTGNPLYMLIAVFFVLFTLGLEVIPIYLFFLKELAEIEFTQRPWYIIGGVVVILLFITLLTTVLSVKASIKRFDKIQFI
jgi:ABC-2 type transport system permease protein